MQRMKQTKQIRLERKNGVVRLGGLEAARVMAEIRR